MLQNWTEEEYEHNQWHQNGKWSIHLFPTVLTHKLMFQVTIIVLLTRSPQVQMEPHGISSGALGYSKESIEWVQKRLSLLSEEMQLAEVHMEKMRQEFAWLRSHLERLERLRCSTWLVGVQEGSRADAEVSAWTRTEILLRDVMFSVVSFFVFNRAYSCTQERWSVAEESP